METSHYQPIFCSSIYGPVKREKSACHKSKGVKRESVTCSTNREDETGQDVYYISTESEGFEKTIKLITQNMVPND